MPSARVKLKSIRLARIQYVEKNNLSAEDKKAQDDAGGMQTLGAF